MIHSPGERGSGAFTPERKPTIAEFARAAIAAAKKAEILAYLAQCRELGKEQDEETKT